MVPQHLSAPVRRAQILDAAHNLFLTKGYDATTIEDILAAVGIAKGTLYHHFPGKEAILDAIVVRASDAIAERAARAASAPGPAPERFLAAVAAARAPEEDIELAQQLRLSGNLRFHVLSMTEGYARLVPILTRVVEEGVASGELSTPDPHGSVEVILAAGLTLLEGGSSPPTEDDDGASAARRQAALARTAALLLGASPDALSAPLRRDRHCRTRSAVSPSISFENVNLDGALGRTPRRAQAVR